MLRVMLAIVAVLAIVCWFDRENASLAFASFLYRANFDNNFHEVVPDRLYRAGEMSNEHLLRKIERHGIKTVVDLRTQHARRGAVESDKREALQKLGVAYKHVSLRSTRIPQKGLVQLLLDVFDQAETPVLVHCKDGVHRSGVAAAIWLLEKEKLPYEIARKQFSWEYGFSSIERNFSSIKHDHPTIDRLVLYYGAAHEKNGVGFREWLEHFPQRYHSRSWRRVEEWRGKSENPALTFSSLSKEVGG